MRMLGQGEWATVYRARPNSAESTCPADYAVKVARVDGKSEMLAAQMMRREALVGNLANHPNLCCVLSARVHRPPYYIVMPYLDGQTVRRTLADVTSIDVPRALSIARQTAEALTALHRIGWLHSDLKPGNVFVSNTGHTTVVDLGLARRIGNDECQFRGPLAGTLAYAAPESFSSLVDLGPASDVYSLGVTLYEMVVGGLPFMEEEPARLAAAHVHCHPPDPRYRNPQISGDLVQLLHSMLDKQPSRRPILDDLTQWIGSLETEFRDEQIAA
jgi:eukaryotic-like serine/threonine-protein kinase